MAYIEHDQLDAQLKKLENVCAENGFTYKFLRDKYPVRIIITPDGTMDGQMSMLDNPVGYNTKGSALAFVFVDGDVYLNPGKEGGLSLSKRLQNKLRTIAEKVYFNYLKVFFIDTLEAKKMADNHALLPAETCRCSLRAADYLGGKCIFCNTQILSEEKGCIV